MIPPPPDSEVQCVILAAGLSTRVKGWKMILPFGDSTVIETTVRQGLSVCSRVILVTGHRAAELTQLFNSWSDVITVYNSDFEKGMFSSIQVGVSHITTDRFFIALGDMPLVSPATYQILLEEKREEAVIPRFQGKNGHPVLLSSILTTTILESDISTTLRDILEGRVVISVPVNDRAVLHDIDTPQDYRRLHDELGV